MKILIATDTYHPHVNGASYFAQRLAYYLQVNGHTVAVIAPSMTYRNTTDHINGVLVYGMWSLPILFYKKFRFCLPPLFLQKHIQKVIDEVKPDIVHIQGHFFVSRTVLRAAKARNIRVVATNHFMPENLVHYLHVPYFVTKRISAWSWYDLAKVFNGADSVTTPTNFAAALLPKQLLAPIKVISNGIDTVRFNPRNDGSNLRARYHISPKPVLLYVGRLDREKNIDVVLRAVAQITKRVDMQFIIAGVGAHRGALENLVRELSIADWVTFVGFVPDQDLSNLYALAQCFVIAGTAELQSIVTMEAMATGLPVLAANASALPELVHDGRNGFLFSTNNDATLIEHMEQLFTNEPLRKQMGAESVKIIVGHDIKKIIAQFESLYQDIITTSRT